MCKNTACTGKCADVKMPCKSFETSQRRSQNPQLYHKEASGEVMGHNLSSLFFIEMVSIWPMRLKKKSYSSNLTFDLVC